MKGLKYIGLITMVVIMVGCGKSNDANMCKKLGYKGAVVETASWPPCYYCSNGEKTKDGKCFKTLEGDKQVKWNWYREFESEMFINQEK